MRGIESFRFLVHAQHLVMFGELVTFKSNLATSLDCRCAPALHQGSGQAYGEPSEGSRRKQGPASITRLTRLVSGGTFFSHAEVRSAEMDDLSSGERLNFGASADCVRCVGDQSDDSAAYPVGHLPGFAES